jgi:Predicted transcriptional regulator with C-terminal CBS domains
MKMSNTFRKMVDQARQSTDYWAAGIALDFATGVDDLMKRKNLSRSELASRIGTSLPYISKVMRGDANFTLETMTRIARAVGATIELRVLDEEAEAFTFSQPSSGSSQKSYFDPNFVPVPMSPANDHTSETPSTATVAA